MNRSAPGASEPQIHDQEVVSPARLVQEVPVRDVIVRDDGTITGTVVNNSGKVLHEVRVMVRHLWLWDDEMHPGTDDLSRADYVTLRQEIPPGGQVAFTYRPDAPLREGRGGHFETDLRTATVVTSAPTAPASPTIGAPPGLPPPESEIVP